MPLLPQYAFMAWCSVKKAQGQLYVLSFTLIHPCKPYYYQIPATVNFDDDDDHHHHHNHDDDDERSYTHVQ
jgi:hypothetical protein